MNQWGWSVFFEESVLQFWDDNIIGKYKDLMIAEIFRGFAAAIPMNECIIYIFKKYYLCVCVRIEWLCSFYRTQGHN